MADKKVEPGKVQDTGGHANSNDALLKLVNELYDTKDDKMHQLTKLNRREILPLSLMMTKNKVMDVSRKAVYDKHGKLIKAHVPLSKIWMAYYFGLKRSEDKWAFMIGAGLAHEQALSTEEDNFEDEHEI